MKSTSRAAVAACLLLVVSACASAPEDIRPAYVSSTAWQGKTCDQLAEEQSQVALDVERVTGKQMMKRRTDQTAVGVGAILFWPALFLMLTPDHKRELATLKGRYEAIERAQEANRCGGAPRPVTASATTAPAAAQTSAPTLAPTLAPAPVATPAAAAKPATPAA